MLRVGVICGGISDERGISLNSARSFLDHTQLFAISLTLIYINPEGNYYLITPSQLYSNTPSDFDFKLHLLSKKLSTHDLVGCLKEVDLVFPLVHGILGEDGTLQALLEAHHIPYVGSSSAVCKKLFNKHAMHTYCLEQGLPTLPSLLLPLEKAKLPAFWENSCKGKAILKPTQSGSSVGVHSIHSLEQLNILVPKLQAKGFSELLLETYCDGKEFTICVLQAAHNHPVALLPLEIDIEDPTNKVLSFRRKYLPTEETRYHCPPRFSKGQIAKIRSRAEWLFTQLHMQDVVRLDGWITQDGEIVFSDFNPISGMEQNSFLFQQAAQVGLSHAELIAYIINHSLQRQKLPGTITLLTDTNTLREPVYVLMGGSTAERQTSLMSGTNVFLKLRQEKAFEPTPFLLDKSGDVWQLPYSYILHHTVEEVEEHCRSKISNLALQNTIRKELGLSPLTQEDLPRKLSLKQFLLQATKSKAFVFIALHGGFGEDGSLQELLENHSLSFNGSDAKASALCMDKHKTAQKIASLDNSDILAMEQICFSLKELQDDGAITALWKKAQDTLKTHDLIIKPQADGCSAGVWRMLSLEDLRLYIDAAKNNQPTLCLGDHRIEMALSSQTFLIEPFIHTDKISVIGSNLTRTPVSGWCEMTVGVIEARGMYTSLPPSITIAENHILSLEEKFQGGTGINLTPPPEEFLPSCLQKKVQESICSVAKHLGIRNYARIDIFVECHTGRIRVIEANTLPALTPSTVLFHQSLCHTPSLSPRQLLVQFIENASTAITV